ncbi:hypothetical protein F5J12DRAFT_859697 [Pisolithus orientalis]|uniref:uncharacterized protein n=1 Tax=Pisolithus orientalis TaxID=936130 RepID=UPI002225082C|nr:uncharacterized protein F5J12DRAFT_859697 [Pisolithus orientalis]KAI5992597.1 hypothetical protein F5J12DRAFT_859697 [Pisolithus orientalis]
MIRDFALQILPHLQKRLSQERKGANDQANGEAEDDSMEDGQLPAEELIKHHTLLTKYGFRRRNRMYFNTSSSSLPYLLKFPTSWMSM